MKPFFSDKGVSTNKITLIEGDNIISKDEEVAEIMNSFFENAVSELEIEEPTQYLTDCSNIDDEVDAIIRKYSSHPSILSIHKNIKKAVFLFIR